MSTPWICYGQQTGPSNAHVDNPTANSNGILGEAKLPYVVPADKTLVITGWGIEAYEAIAGSFVLVPWIGELPADNAKCLHSVLASSGTSGFEYHVPGGAKFNVRIICSEGGNPTAGWWISGRLEATI